MFSWASNQLEKLSLAVAPPPTEPVSRFVFLMQKESEEEALQCLMSKPDAVHAVVNPTKGSYAIHLACQSSMVRLAQYILTQPGSNVQITDASGNTPLHYAALSQRMDQAAQLCRVLVADFGASVVAKNALGQTPYDVATLTSVRQYLLPLQLQFETKQSLDNGGAGLPPGIDLGANRIQQNNIPGVGPPPPPTSFGNNISFGASTITPTAAATAASGGPTHMFATPMSPPTGVNPMNPPPVMNSQTTYGIAPAPATMPPMIQQHEQQHEQQQPPMSQGSIAAPPTSGNNSNSLSTHSREYARTGSSSAALDSISNRSRSFVKADGFHSSSSDMNLHNKYGNVTISTKAVPPPPMSGNSSVPLHSNSITSAGVNPFSGGSAVLGASGINRYGHSLPHSSRRYLVYDAVAGVAIAPRSAPLYAAATNLTASTTVPNFSVFTPITFPTTSASSNDISEKWSQQEQDLPGTTPTTPWQQDSTYQQQDGVAPIAVSAGQTAAAAHWQQPQQPTWQGSYAQPSSTTAATAATWQPEPSPYGEPEPPTSVAPVADQSWQVGYASVPSTYATQNVPITLSPLLSGQQPVAAEAFFAPPPIMETTTTTSQPYNNDIGEVEQYEAEPSGGVASQPESLVGDQQASYVSTENTPINDLGSSVAEPSSQMAVAASAATTLPSTGIASEVFDATVDTSSWSSSTLFQTSQPPPPRPEPVSLFGTFEAEVRTTSGTSIAEDFFSAPGPTPSTATVVVSHGSDVAVSTTAIFQQKTLAQASGSWGAPEALGGVGLVAAGDFFSSPPTLQQQDQQEATVEATSAAIQETPATESATASTTSQETAEQFPPASVALQEALGPSTVVVEKTESTAIGLFTSNAAPASEMSASGPLDAATLFSQGPAEGPSVVGTGVTSIPQQPPSAENISSAGSNLGGKEPSVAVQPDAATLFSRFPGQEKARGSDTTITAASLFGQQPPSLSFTNGGSALDAATLFMQRPVAGLDAASIFDQRPTTTSGALGLSSLGAADTFEATNTRLTSDALETCTNGPTASTTIVPESAPLMAVSIPSSLADTKQGDDGEEEELSADTLHNSVIGDDELYDVALSPNSTKKSCVIETEIAAAATSAATETSSSAVAKVAKFPKAAESLFAAIGLPPPPFSSSKQ